MAKRNYLEIDPKPSIFANLIDYSGRNDDLEENWLMTDTEAMIPEVDDLFDIPSNFKIIKPIQGLCVKTKTDKNEKVFINLCHHNAVPPPPSSMIVDDIITGSEDSLLRFPLSLGDLRIEKDKSGHDCMCFDAVINSDYYKSEVFKQTRIRDFILNLASSGFEQKYNITFDNGSLRILTKPYHGKMVDHFIPVGPQTNEKILPFDETMFEDDTVISDSKKGIFSNIIDSDGNDNGSEEVNLIEEAAFGIPKISEYKKAKAGIKEISNGTVMPGSKTPIFSNIIDSDAKDNASKKDKLIEEIGTAIPKISEYKKTITGTKEISNDTVMPNSNTGIFSNIIDSDAKDNRSEEVKLIEEAAATIPKISECKKTETGTKETSNSSDTINRPIKPKPALCVKTKTFSNEKVFINLCYHNAVPPAPPSVGFQEMFLDPKGEPFWRYPISLGEPHTEKDKSGNDCNCFDVVVNDNYYLLEISKKPALLKLILILAATGILERHPINIDVGSFKILNKPYHGKMPDHFISLFSKPDE